ncbi:radical SAM protein, partial [Omnitrophica bacterium]|nr:radical SAM protein [Candidatus Omnitrophota bacterium]
YQAHKTAYFRHRDPASFIKRLKRLKQRYDLELIYFQDGTFLTMSNDVLKRLSELYEEEINLPCIILTTPTSIDETRLGYLKKMRCIYVNMGIEEGNPEFREKVLRRRMSDKRIIDAFKLVRKHGIYTAAYDVIGFPYETRADIFKTIELNRKCLPNSVYAQIFYPIEGCELNDTCLEKGFFNPANVSLYSQILDVGNVSILEGLPLSRQDIHNLLKTFYLYVKVPKVFYPFIRLLEKDTPFSRNVISRMTRSYWRHEPRFTDADSLRSAG